MFKIKNIALLIVVAIPFLQNIMSAYSRNTKKKLKVEKQFLHMKTFANTKLDPLKVPHFVRSKWCYFFTNSLFKKIPEAIKL